MPSMFSTIAVAALAAGATQAIPHVARQATNNTVNSQAQSFASSCIPIPDPVVVDPLVASAAAIANLALARNLTSQPTQIDRFNALITKDGAGKELLTGKELSDRVVFDFNKAAAVKDKDGKQISEGGRILVANEDNFPILVGEGISGAVAFLEQCGMNSPHTHPRATEMLTVVQGKLTTGFMLENNFAKPADGSNALTTQVSAELTAFQSTIFPQGSIHFQFNDNCQPATFVAALNSADPGTSQIAQNFFFLNDSIVDITLGGMTTIDGSNIDMFRDKLPVNLVQDMDNCLARCSNGGY